jgi:tetratricopeptide (TPR) repeat protein
MSAIKFRLFGVLLLATVVHTQVVCAEDSILPKDASVMRQQHIRLANRYSSEKKYREALREYNLLIASDPTNPELYISRGYAALNLKDYQSALADAKRVSQISKFNGHLYSSAKLQAKAAAGMNNKEEAIKQYLIASEKFQGNADDQFELGKLFISQNRNDEALLCLQKSLEQFLLAKENPQSQKSAAEAKKLIEQAQRKISVRARNSKKTKVD